MTLHEIEQTLDTLRARHSGLDEGMLVTLLRSGGWEEKQVEEARMMFKAGSPQESPEKEYIPLPPVETELVLPSTVDDKHLLLAHNDEVVEVKEEPEAQPADVSPVVIATPSIEQQSLISSAPVQSTETRDGLPHNLPLRPFETSEHIWPLSRYKDVFYGNTTEEAHAEVSHSEIKTQTPVVEERVVYKTPERVQSFVPVPQASAQPSNGDEKLVMMACVMLLIILLLLGYMYSNGRL